MRLEPEFMTLEELAGYVRINKRTIHNWAQSGKIPAYRLEGEWRFRRDEIDEWLRAQRPGSTMAQQKRRCSVCSRDETDDRPMAGECSAPECTRPICGTCWGIIRRRECSAHVLDSVPSSKGELERVSGGGQTDGLRASRKRLSNSSVNLLSARFLDGFSRRVEGRPHLVSSAGTLIARVNSWSLVKQSGSGDPYGKKTPLRTSRGSTRPPLTLTTTGWVTYAIKLPGRSREGSAVRTLRLEARVLSVSTRRIRKRQSDSQPISRRHLEHTLEDALLTAESEKVHRILGLYASQGWAEDAHEMLDHPNSSERFQHSNLSVALVGPDPSRAVWNSSDPIIVDLGMYFVETPEGEVVECKERIRELINISGVYLVRRIVKEEGFRSSVVHEAIVALFSAKEVEVVTEQGEEAIVKKE